MIHKQKLAMCIKSILKYFTRFGMQLEKPTYFAMITLLNQNPTYGIGKRI